MLGTLHFSMNDAAVQKSLTDLAVLLSPVGMTAFLGGQVGPYLARRAGERFQSEGDDVTGPWAPLKPATVQIRESQGYPGDHPINRRTGELEEWVVQGGWDAYPQGIGATLRFPGKTPQGELRSKVETAQKGKGYPSTVARPVLGINERDMLFVIAALNANIAQVFGP